MNSHERWNYIKNNEEIIGQHMAQHDEEVKTRQLVKFLQKGIDKMNFDIEYLVIRLHDIAREVEQQVGVSELSHDIRACADRLSDLNKTK
jgi:uncharacterized protein YecA (UPF0149 family)